MNTPQELAQCILLASDHQSAFSQKAASILDELRHSADGGAQLCVQLIQTQRLPFDDDDDSDNHFRVVFYALSNLQYSLQQMRRLVTWPSNDSSSSRQTWSEHLAIVLFQYIHDAHFIPKYLRTKIGILFALLIQLDFPQSWPTAFDDLIHQLTSPHPTDCFKHDIFLLTLQAFCDEVVDDPSWSHNTFIKDVMRNITNTSIPSEPNIVSKILQAIWDMALLYKPLVYNNPTLLHKNHEAQVMMQHIPIRAFTVFNRFIPWVDIKLVTHSTIDLIMQDVLSKVGGPADTDDYSPSAQLAVQALQYYTELIHRGMEENKKIQIVLDINILQILQNSGINMQKVDVTCIHVVIKAAELVNLVGLEIIPRWEQYKEGNIIDLENHHALFLPLMQQLLFHFYHLFAYDDIDVSGAVTPLASRIITSIEKEIKSPSSSIIRNGKLLSEEIQPILNILYTQMRYPATFQFDYEDEDEAEEEVYRSELRRLFISICRVQPDVSLQFVTAIFYNLPLPLSSAPTSNLEAALRLVYHYCEGLRPAPGVSTALKNEVFRNLLLALHNSDVAMHTHREVLILYYDVVVRYCSLFQRHSSSALDNVLSALTGTAGLQHTHTRVRSRSCYLLLKLVQAMGKGMNQYTEAVVLGIQGFVSCSNKLPVEDEDLLYLYETVGLVLGNSDLHVTKKQSLLTTIIRPQALSIEQYLAQANLTRDPEYYGKILSNSVAAIAYLSKGFSNPENEIQQVFIPTLPLCHRVLVSLPINSLVRNKTLIYLQRMIYSLGVQVLNSLPPFIAVLIENVDVDDISDVGQLLMQISTKFQGDALQILDTSILVFIRRCEILAPKLDDVADTVEGLPPHHVAEQLLIKKLMFALLNNVVSNHLSEIFISPTNAPFLDDVLKIMHDGVLHVDVPSVKRHCINFYRELIQQWGPEDGLSIHHQHVRFGFLHFIYNRVCPDVLDMVFGSSFNELDATESRLLRDIGFLFYDLFLSRGAEEFKSTIIACISRKTQSTLSDVSLSMEHVVSHEDMSAVINQLVSRSKRKP